MTERDLPALNAILNFTSSVFLVWGFVKIKRREQEAHKKLMLIALLCSALFLCSYLVYHSFVGSVPYPYTDWTRPVYFTILIPHIIFAALMTPFILYAVWQAKKGAYQIHAKVMRWVWPVWIFVSISGVLVYLMLYQQDAVRH